MKKKWILGIVALVLILLVGRTLYVAGSFKTIQSHTAGTLTTVYTNVPGPEDFDMDEAAGLLFISSSDRWKTMRGDVTDDGIYLLLPDSTAPPRKLVTTYTGEFHPHGISYFKGDSANYLFVVNHNADGNFVGIFKFQRDTLFHQISYKEDRMCCPNDVVAVAPDKFYVTNDHGTRGGLMRVLEDYLLIPRSYLLYFDGHTFSKAVEGLNYGNGVNVSRDGRKLFLTQTTGQTLTTFDRNIDTGTLELKDKINLHTGLDNVAVDADGNLWIGAHPKLLAFVDHAKDPQKPSPSQVFKLTPNPATGSYSVTEIYLDDGKQLSGCSVALRYKNDIFIGAVFESKVLRMSLN